MSEERRYKQCPDCAEQVLVAARKCRFCGYRFDATRHERGGAAGLISRIMRRPPKASMAELLADWGLVLEEGETVSSFELLDLDGELSFMLLTSERLAFARAGAQVTEEPRVYWLGDLLEVRLDGRRLEVEGRGPDFHHTLTKPGRMNLAELAQQLSSRVR